MVLTNSTDSLIESTDDTDSADMKLLYLCWLLQIHRVTETYSQVSTGLAPSPVPHFTVSKVSVPKHESSSEVRAPALGKKELNPTKHRNTCFSKSFHP